MATRAEMPANLPGVGRQRGDALLPVEHTRPRTTKCDELAVTGFPSHPTRPPEGFSGRPPRHSKILDDLGRGGGYSHGRARPAGGPVLEIFLPASTRLVARRPPIREQRQITPDPLGSNLEHAAPRGRGSSKHAPLAVEPSTVSGAMGGRPGNRRW